MPIYQYACGACGHQMEALQKIGAAPLTDCPVCGKPELRKQLTAAAFRLKGTGWYETDFKSSGSGKPGETSTPTDVSDGGSAKTKEQSAKPPATGNSESGNSAVASTAD